MKQNPAELVHLKKEKKLGALWKHPVQIQRHNCI